MSDTVAINPMLHELLDWATHTSWGGCAHPSHGWSAAASTLQRHRLCTSPCATARALEPASESGKGRHLQSAQQRGVEVQRQQRVDDLHWVLLEDQARVEVCRHCLHLQRQRDKHASAICIYKSSQYIPAGTSGPRVEVCRHCQTRLLTHGNKHRSVSSGQQSFVT